MAMDVCLLVVAVFITKSTMLMVGLCVVLVVSPFLSGITLRRVATVIAILVCSLAGSLVYANHSNDLLASTIRGAYQSPDVMEYLMGRGANRVPRMRAARDVFLEHEWMGVGIGAYESAIRRRNMSAYSAGQWWISVADQPAVNIYLELLATTGLLGAAPMFGFFARTLMLSRLRSLDYIQRSYLLACVCLLIMLNFDSNYLRPYLWMILGVYSGSVGPSAVVARRDIERSEQDSMDKARERGGSE
jgi:O-antigen ligase